MTYSIVKKTTIEDMKRICMEVAQELKRHPEGIDQDVPEDYVPQFILDMNEAGLMVTQINDWLDIEIQLELSIAPDICFGVYRDHATMVEREKGR